MNDKPKFYITRDRDGMFLWFSCFPPILKHKRFQNNLATPIRLPLSWFDHILDIGECREIDVETVLSLNHA